MTTTLTYSKQQSVSVAAPQTTGMSGFRAAYQVTNAVNIDPAIFIMHREAMTAAGDNFTDTYFTVASVADLETIPNSPMPSCGFYRSASIDLIFRNMEDLVRYCGQIEGMIAALVRANDDVLALQPATTVTLS